ncbi:MAG: threonine synthase [Thermotoga sp.]|nr:MAG: threonine synthase [Thermotoga sp.]
MINNYVMDMICTKCGKSFNEQALIFRCHECNAPLEIIYDYDKLSHIINKTFFTNRTNTLWRYFELLPLKNKANIISLNEGWTPLHKSENLSRYLKINTLYLKDESRNPTGSFKDRGTTVGISKAVELDVTTVGCASTGNMAASTAAYAAKAGKKCIILITNKTPIEKVIQILIYNPLVFSVDLPYPELYTIIYKLAKNYGIYIVQSDTAQRVEGQKTIAYEICEQLQWSVPDVVIVPTSSGGNISAIWKGFKEFLNLGLIKKLPRMICVQSEGCAPIVKAYKEHASSTELWRNPNTIAHSISNPDPRLASSERTLKLLKESHGYAIAVSDNDILHAQKILALKEGIFAEPASAAPIAAIPHLLEKGVIEKDDKIVCIITGTGLKDIKSSKRNINRPIEIKDRKQLYHFIETLT